MINAVSIGSYLGQLRVRGELRGSLDLDPTPLGRKNLISHLSHVVVITLLYGHEALVLAACPLLRYGYPVSYSLFQRNYSTLSGRVAGRRMSTSELRNTFKTTRRAPKKLFALNRGANKRSRKEPKTD
jgi:hypothetical protein